MNFVQKLCLSLLATLVAVLVTVTLTLGTTAPEASVTFPVIAPVVVWAAAADTQSRQYVKIAIPVLMAIPLIPVANYLAEGRTSLSSI